MYYLIYKITLLKGSLKDSYYIGQHRTLTINDGYAGSGKILRDYYKKYGKVKGETYTKEILYTCNSLEELNNAEALYIGTLYSDDEKCINLKAGGGTSGISEETRKKLSESHMGHKQSEETKRKISKNNVNKKQAPWNKGMKKERPPKHILTSEERSAIYREVMSRPDIKANHAKAMQNPETKRKMSVAKKGNSNALGHTVCEESREKMRVWTGYHWKKDPVTGKRIYYKND